jgi:hypothetical protein
LFFLGNESMGWKKFQPAVGRNLVDSYGVEA